MVGSLSNALVKHLHHHMSSSSYSVGEDATGSSRHLHVRVSSAHHPKGEALGETVCQLGYINLYAVSQLLVWSDGQEAISNDVTLCKR